MTFATEIQDYVNAEEQLSVLVVDDSAGVRAAIRQVLELVNIRVIEAGDGRSALQVVYEQAPDLVVLDMEMPVLSGLSVLDTIRKSYSKMELPVVMMTPLDAASGVVSTLDRGANDYVTRPLDLDILWARISNQLMQKQAAEYLQTARQELEHQVRQRTAELDAINNRLKSEIRQRKNAQEKLKKQANYDQLTGLPNRHLAIDRLKQVVVKAQRQGLHPCVAYLDLDDFKTINDTLGHAAGDELLRQVARRLTACARKSDTVSRLGGDEFLLILDDDGREPAQMREHAISRVGDRIIESISRPFDLEGGEVVVTTSIGFAIYGKDGDDGGSLMRNADVSMYRSKNEGKNSYCFYSPDMMAKSRIRHFVENQLQRAFDEGQLDLVYQPVVELDSGRVGCVEASLRWNNNDMGFIAPEVFMPVAEESGLIVPLGAWMIGCACDQLRRWRSRDDALRLTLNLSPRQLKDANLTAVIRRALDHNRLPGDALMVELTEAMLLANPAVDEALDGLRAMGVGLVLDEFATDQASMASMQRCHFDMVKIARHGLDADAAGSSGDMVRALAAFTGVLDMKLVAFGVEDAGQAESLRSAGCHAAQGGYFSEPLAADGMTAMFERARSRSNRGGRLHLVSEPGD